MERIRLFLMASITLVLYSCVQADPTALYTPVNTPSYTLRQFQNQYQTAKKLYEQAQQQTKTYQNNLNQIRAKCSAECGAMHTEYITEKKEYEALSNRFNSERDPVVKHSLQRKMQTLLLSAKKLKLESETCEKEITKLAQQQLQQAKDIEIKAFHNVQKAQEILKLAEKKQTVVPIYSESPTRTITTRVPTLSILKSDNDLQNTSPTQYHQTPKTDINELKFESEHS